MDDPNEGAKCLAFGDPRLPERFWEKVIPTDLGCWIWIAKTTKGYGRYWFRGYLPVAHRAAYIALVSELSDAVTLDHLCRVRHCVNPAHLEPVSNHTNIMRGTGPSADNARKTHCPQGHPYSGENLLSIPPRPGRKSDRRCRACGRAHSKRKRQRAAGRRAALAGKETP